MSSSVSFGLIALVSFVVFFVLSIRRTIDFIRATGEEHQAVLEGKRPTPLSDMLLLFLFMVAFPICMTLLTGKATFEFLIQQYSAMPSSKASVSESIMAPTSGPWGEDETTDETIGSSSRTVYWVPNGKSYHFSRSCPSLSRSDEIECGTLQEARAAGKKDPCNNCAK